MSGIETKPDASYVVNADDYSPLVNNAGTVGKSVTPQQYVKAAAAFGVDDKAEALTHTPVTGQTMYIRSDDGKGHIWQAKTGLTGAVSGSVNYCGTRIVDASWGGALAWDRDYNGAVNIKWFGAKGDGTTDDTTAIQNALDASRNVYIPSGVYLVSLPIRIEHDGQELIGDGSDLSEIKSVTATINVLEFTTKSLIILGKLEDIHIHAAAGNGGHALYQAVGIAQIEFNRVGITQANPAKSLYANLDGTIYIDNHWKGFNLVHTPGATNSGFKLIDTAGGNLNSNTWEKGRCTHSGNYFFSIENSGSGTYEFDLHFSDINFEVCTGGGIRGLGVQNLTTKNLMLYDTPNATKDFIYIGASANVSPLKSRHIHLENTFSRNSTFAVGVDIMLEAGGVDTAKISGGDAANLAGFTVDLGNNLGVVLIDTRNWTINNRSVTTVEISAYSGKQGLRVGNTIDYTYDNLSLDIAKINGASGLLLSGQLYPQSSAVAGASGIYQGAGTPEASQAANQGSIYMNNTIAIGEYAVYIKLSGTTTTGWLGIGTVKT